MSTLYKQADQYLSMRRKLGFKLRGHDTLLHSFIDYLSKNGAISLSAEAALNWATLPTDVQPTRWAQRLCAVRGFTRYLHGMDPTVLVPSTDLLPVRRHRQAPNLFSHNDIARLLEEASKLQPVFRAATYESLFGLLAVTGMRVGEAISLDREHVNLETGVLHITDAKFRKTRRLPLHASSIVALSHYVKLRDELCKQPKTPSFFLSTRDTRLLYPVVNGVFRKCMDKIELDNYSGNKPARIHDLRHSFAVTTLRDWYRAGAGVQAQLPILSAYLGHGSPASTYWYLQNCPELLMLAAQRVEQTRRFSS